MTLVTPLQVRSNSFHKPGRRQKVGCFLHVEWVSPKAENSAGREDWKGLSNSYLTLHFQFKLGERKEKDGEYEISRDE